jgi:hypothetical protein
MPLTEQIPPPLSVSFKSWNQNVSGANGRGDSCGGPLTQIRNYSVSLPDKGDRGVSLKANIRRDEKTGSSRKVTANFPKIAKGITNVHGGPHQDNKR